MWEAVALAAPWGECLAWCGVGGAGEAAALGRLAACLWEAGDGAGAEARLGLSDGRALYVVSPAPSIAPRPATHSCSVETELGAPALLFWAISRDSSLSGEALTLGRALLAEAAAVDGLLPSLRELERGAAQRSQAYSFQDALTAPPGSARAPAVHPLLAQVQDRGLRRLLSKPRWGGLSGFRCALVLDAGSLEPVLGYAGGPSASGAAPGPPLAGAAAREAAVLALFRACCLRRDLSVLRACCPDELTALLRAAALAAAAEPDGAPLRALACGLECASVRGYVLVAAPERDLAGRVVASGAWPSALLDFARFLD
jgi:hypothetical protein